MSANLLTEKVWNSITKAVKNSKFKSYVAVAYFGQGGAKLLPLSSGSILVVDASEGAVKSGQTCPPELIKLQTRGVKIFSHTHLHSKIFVIGTKLFIGSANVSTRSANILTEALFTTTDRNVVAKTKKYIQELAKYELGPERLKALSKIYKPPRNGGNRKQKEGLENSPQLFLYRLALKGYTVEEEIYAKSGKKEAEKKRINRKFNLDEFAWSEKNNINAREGDIAMQIVNDEEKTYVSVPGTIINIKRWHRKGRAHAIFHVEVPVRRRKNIELVKRRLSESAKRALKRSSRKNNDFEDEILSLWN